ncbi:hypothetical protein BO94DRAFT_593442 [Aspergillus sclerotioniger CBS 115572]|uniref:Uncharacterized protein n=1 Tax=Aspergillus sclerotioniger CBS 115572 TaxID=1450535 RepID=A0A317WXE1_9EURO|nr:hypothetical protein BO94DRAFT_593442 [Aspergillus sclerotioniger CBS 115572]PWY90561.1 hypothetical protein BO94DRAFT_593442 [Aspergillus sclerotioniger CBS 115572]
MAQQSRNSNVGALRGNAYEVKVMNSGIVCFKAPLLPVWLCSFVLPDTCAWPVSCQCNFSRQARSQEGHRHHPQGSRGHFTDRPYTVLKVSFRSLSNKPVSRVNPVEQLSRAENGEGGPGLNKNPADVSGDSSHEVNIRWGITVPAPQELDQHGHGSKQPHPYIGDSLTRVDIVRLGKMVDGHHRISLEAWIAPHFSHRGKKLRVRVMVNLLPALMSESRTGIESSHRRIGRSSMFMTVWAWMMRSASRVCLEIPAGCHILATTLGAHKLIHKVSGIIRRRNTSSDQISVQLQLPQSPIDTMHRVVFKHTAHRTLMVVPMRV